MAVTPKRGDWWSRLSVRVACRFQKRDGFIVLDQVRTIDRERLVRKLGRLAPSALASTLTLLHELFAP